MGVNVHFDPDKGLISTRDVGEGTVDLKSLGLAKITRALTDPVSSSDSLSGYSIGSRWYNTSSQEEFVCLDATPTAAIWTSTTSGNGLVSGDPQVTLKFQPGGTSSIYVATTWAEVVEFAATKITPWSLIVDYSLGEPRATSTFDFGSYCTFKGEGSAGGYITIADGAQIINPKGLSNFVMICESTTTAGVVLNNGQVFALTELSIVQNLAGATVPAVKVDTQYAIIEIADGSYFYRGEPSVYLMEFTVANGEHNFVTKLDSQGAGSPIPTNSILCTDINTYFYNRHDASGRIPAQSGIAGTFEYFPFDNLTYVGGTITDTQHGVRGGGTQHAVATSGAAGFMSAADKVRVDAAPQKYSANIGDGIATSIVVTHNLGTRDVQVQVYDNSSPWGPIACDAQRTSTNTVTLVFGGAPTTNQYRVVIIG